MSATGSDSPGAGSSGLRLLIGSDSSFDALVRAARAVPVADTDRLLVLFGAEETFPFRPRPSTIMVAGMPPGVIASVPALEEFGIASRLASSVGLPGCYDGKVHELADLWLHSLQAEMRTGLHITVVGHTETVEAMIETGRRMLVRVDAIQG